MSPPNTLSIMRSAVTVPADADTRPNAETCNASFISFLLPGFLKKFSNFSIACQCLLSTTSPALKPFKPSIKSRRGPLAGSLTSSFSSAATILGPIVAALPTPPPTTSPISSSNSSTFASYCSSVKLSLALYFSPLLRGLAGVGLANTDCLTSPASPCTGSPPLVGAGGADGSGGKALPLLGSAVLLAKTPPALNVLSCWNVPPALPSSSSVNVTPPPGLGTVLR